MFCGGVSECLSGQHCRGGQLDLESFPYRAGLASENFRPRHGLAHPQGTGEPQHLQLIIAYRVGRLTIAGPQLQHTLVRGKLQQAPLQLAAACKLRDASLFPQQGRGNAEMRVFRPTVFA